MHSVHTDIVILSVFINIFFGAEIFLTGIQFKKQKFKYPLISLELFSFLWSNIYLYQNIFLTQFDDRLIRSLTNTLCYATLLGLIASLFYFLLSLTQAKLPARKILIPIALNAALIILLSALNLIEYSEWKEGVGWVRNFGKLFPYFALTQFGLVTYGLFFLFLRARKAADRLKKFQTYLIIGTAIFSISGFIMTQLVIPLVVKGSFAEYYGILWPVFFIAFVLLILVYGPVLYFSSQMFSLLFSRGFDLFQNFEQLNAFFNILKNMIRSEGNPQALRLHFKVDGEKIIAVNLAGSNVIYPVEMEDASEGGTSLKDAPYKINEITKLIEEKALLSTFAPELIANSSVSIQTLSAFEQLSRWSKHILIYGETGSGRSALAKAVHRARFGFELPTIDCHGKNINEIVSFCETFLANKKSQRGLLIQHLDSIESLDFRQIVSIMRNSPEGKNLYFTASPNIFSVLDPADPDIEALIKEIAIEVKSLRDRKDDILPLFVYFLNRHIEEREKFTGINPLVIDRLMNYSWPGNLYELENTVRKAIYLNPGPDINEISVFKHAGGAGLISDAGLSPIEESEKKVIVKYLIQNNYNKSQAIRDLGITINTLNVKIKRYKIPIPERN